MERTCKHHGEHSEWERKNKGKGKLGWGCLKCRRVRVNKRNRRKNYEKLLAVSGKAIADKYLEDAATSNSRVTLWDYLPYNMINPMYRYHRIAAGQQQKRDRIKLLCEINASVEPIWKCAKCSFVSENTYMFDIHHIIPKCKGGTNNIVNLQILCPTCHRSLHINPT